MEISEGMFARIKNKIIKINQIIENGIHIIEDILKEVEWMDEPQAREIRINFVEGKEKALLKIDYIHIYLGKKFNWLQKRMFKFLLGVEIEDIWGGINEFRSF